MTVAPGHDGELGLSCYLRDGELWLDGEADAGSAHILRAFLRTHRAERMTLNFSALRFIDSAGLGALFELVRDGCHVTIRAPLPQVAKVLNIAGVVLAGITVET